MQDAHYDDGLDREIDFSNAIKNPYVGRLKEQKTSRIILWMRAAGLTDTQIDDFILYIETGDSKYFPKESE